MHSTLYFESEKATHKPNIQVSPRYPYLLSGSGPTMHSQPFLSALVASPGMTMFGEILNLLELNFGQNTNGIKAPLYQKRREDPQE